MTAGNPNEFVIDPDAHAKAKVDGDYTPDGSGEKNETDENEESIIPKEDPDNPDAEESDESTEDGEGEGDEDGEESDEDGDENEETGELTEFEADFSSWTDEFMNDGQLSEETRQTVLDTVFSEKVPESMRADFIAAYEAGLTALRSETTRGVFDLVGGEQNYQQMLAWGNDNLSQDEADVFDKAALGTDPATRTAAVKGLYAQFQQATGFESGDSGPDLSHDSGHSGGEPIIASRRQLAKIQSTDEYKKDPAVRAKVARQLRQSMATGRYENDQE
jgi:hypothetical protein